jgi:hypothetical protein
MFFSLRQLSQISLDDDDDDDQPEGSCSQTFLRLVKTSFIYSEDSSVFVMC